MPSWRYRRPVPLLVKLFSQRALLVKELLRKNAWGVFWELHELFWQKSRNVLRPPLAEDYGDLGFENTDWRHSIDGTSRQVFYGIPIPTERRHEPLLIIEGDGDHSLMRVRTELYHKAISVESPGQGALSNRELESLTRGFQTSPQKPETPEEELLKLLSRGAEFQLESRPGPKQSELSKKPRTGAITTRAGSRIPISKAKAPFT